MMKYNFPKDFWWGSAVSGPQTEGVFLVIIKVTVHGIIGINKSQNCFLIKLDLKKHRIPICVSKKMFNC